MTEPSIVKENDDLLIYKFRSMKCLIDFKELEGSYIYQSCYSELNDPLDGYIDIVFDGDKILWTNFLKNFAFSYLALSHHIKFFEFSDSSPFSNNTLERFFLDQNFVHHYVERHKCLKNIWDKDVSGEPLNDTLKFLLHNPEKTIYINELYVILREFHKRIVDLEERHLGKKENEWLQEKIAKLTPLLLNSDQLQGEYFLSIAKEAMELRLSLSLFTKHYLNKLNKLMFKSPFVVSFTKSIERLPLWAHYADSSRGACLIFNTKKNNGIHHLSLSEHKDQEFNYIPINKVSYQSILNKVSFFEFLGGGLPEQTLRTYWYELEGQRSSLGDAVLNNLTGYIDAYRKTKKNLFITKLCEWEREDEYRIVQETTAGRLYYKLDSLHGIVFGINAKASDKLKVISILDSLIRKNKDDGLSINIRLYDAEYISSQNRIAIKLFGLVDKELFRFVNDKG